MYSIGEFSRITGFSVKALRLYHEKGLLVPSQIDDSSGYRYYDHKNAERARIIKKLKGMEFSLADITDILEDTNDEAEVIDFFEKKRSEILSKIRRQKKVVKNLDQIIQIEKEAMMTMESTEFEVEEKDLDTLLVAGVRYKGKYSDCGEYFGKIARKMGRQISGNPLNLYYDAEYKEEDADIETCYPVKKGKEVNGITVHELEGGPCVSLIHKGSYDTLGRSYEKLVSYIKEKGYKDKLPSREIYIKGPGMVLKGNPDNYLTELQIMVEK